MSTVAAAVPPQRAETLGSVWGRRLVSVPAYLLLASLCVVTAPAWLTLALVSDAVTGKVPLLPRTRALCFFAVYLGCEVAGITGSLAIWCFTAGGRLGGPVAYVAANATLQRWFSGALLGGALRVFSMRVDAEGLERARAGPILLFVRHTSTADTVLAAYLVANPFRLLLRYVIKRELLWDPCLDIVGRRLPNAFVDRHAARGTSEIDAIARLAEGLDERSGVLIYPEGTRFTPEKLAAAIAGLRAKGLTRLATIAGHFRHVLPPKLGGPMALLDAAPTTDVVLLEHTGFEGARSFATFMSGALVGRTIHVRLRRFPAAEIPRVDRDVWLFERWGELDQWISGVEDQERRTT